MNMINQEDNNQIQKNYCIKYTHLKDLPLRILLAEDDVEMRKMLSWYLQKNGINVVECKDGNDLIKHLGFSGPIEYFSGFDLIISDIRMPGATGLQVLETGKEYEGFPPMILITAFPDEKTSDIAARFGAMAVLAKPFDIDELLNLISEIFPLELIPGKDISSLHQQVAANVNFPFDLRFRHDLKIENIKTFIHNLAAKLNRFDRHIINLRVVVEQSGPDPKSNHIYHIKINIKVPGKTIIVKHDSDTGSTHENLYSALHIAFGTAGRRLKQHLKKAANSGKQIGMQS